MARCFPQFEHNYNQVSREVMYNWFNKHLKLGQPEPVVEKPFEPIAPADLSVYDQDHPRPSRRRQDLPRWRCHRTRPLPGPRSHRTRRCRRAGSACCRPARL